MIHRLTSISGKSWSVFLAIVLAVGLMPLPAYADNEVAGQAGSISGGSADLTAGTVDMTAQADFVPLHTIEYTSDGVLLDGKPAGVGTSDGAVQINETNGLVMISKAGTYSVKGSASVEQGIEVHPYSSGGFVIVMDGLSLETSEGPALHCVNGADVTIDVRGDVYLADGTDAGGSSNADAAAVLIDKPYPHPEEQASSLKITGSGTLNVKGFSGCAIRGGYKSKLVLGGWSGDNVKINASTEAFSPGSDAISCDGTIEVFGGTTTAESLNGDGMTATPVDEDVDSAGAVVVHGGTLHLSGERALSARGNITVEGGEVVTTGSAQEAVYTAGSFELTGGRLATHYEMKDESSETPSTIYGRSRGIIHAEKNVSITAGELDICQANSEGSRAVGVYAGGDVVISGGNTLMEEWYGDAISAAGNVVASGGTVTVSSYGDAISAAGNIEVSGGTFKIATGYGSKMGYDTAYCTDYFRDARSTQWVHDSEKGLKASKDASDVSGSTNAIYITGGSLELNTYDSALYSDGYIQLEGGDFEIITSNAAAHAGIALTLGKRGDANCKVHFCADYSYDGLEAGSIYLYSGCHSIYSVDDGINTGGGNDAVDNPGQGFKDGGYAGRPGHTTREAETGGYALNIYGGSTVVNATGFGDGIDARGNLNVLGGNTVVWGGESASEGVISYGDAFTVKGGTLLAVGHNIMAGKDPVSSQYYTERNGDVAAEKTVTVQEKGARIFSLKAPRKGDYVFYSSPSMTSATSADITVDDSEAAGYDNWTEHAWGAPAWTWNESHSSAKATFTCTACGEKKDVQATIASSRSGKTTTYVATARVGVSTFVDKQAVTGNATGARLSGSVRYDTMYKIAKEFGSCTTAVVVSGEAFPDALSASGLAGLYKCPVLLTNPKSLSSQTKKALTELGVKRVIIVGGTNAVSKTVESAIKGMGITIMKRISGTDRYATSLQVHKECKNAGASYDKVIVASGNTFPDALSVAPLAYSMQMPIILVNPRTGISNSAKNALKADSKAKQVIIVGGDAAVPKSVDSALSSYKPKRLAGSDRYATSGEIAKWGIQNGMHADNMGVATGENFPDALAGGALCGYRGSVMALVSDKNQNAVSAAIKADKASAGSMYVFGGSSAVSAAVMTKCVNIANGK